MTGPFFCERCLADNELRAEVLARGGLVDRCPTCGSQNVKGLPTTDATFRKVFRALIRLHYSEWEYNTHLGGDPLESLLFGENEIFSLGPGASELDFEDAYLPLEEDWYPDPKDDVSLGGGYWNGSILIGLRADLESGVDSVIRHVLFPGGAGDVENEALGLLASIRNEIDKVMPADTAFFRARLGVGRRYRAKLFGWGGPSYSYLPHSGSGISAPPVGTAGEGRLNLAGVSVLYLASDRPTAVAELRPHPGHLVSTAEFRACGELRVADFATQDIRDYLSDDRLEVLRRVRSLGALLNVPVQPDAKVMYVITRLLGDCLQSSGFDGVLFKSSLGKGNNLVIFDPTRFGQVEKSEETFEVRSLAYSLEPRNTMPQDFDRSGYDEDNDDPLSTVFHGLARYR